MIDRNSLRISWPLIFASTVLVGPVTHAQLFENLRALNRNIPVGSGAVESDPNTGEPRRADGPRWICAADFDADGKADFATCHLNGEITTAYGRGDGTFESPVIIQSGTADLRAIAAGDFNHDGRADLAAAAPYDGKVTVRLSQPGRTFAPPLLLESFKHARNLTTADFDGDGHLDIAAAGPDERIPGYDPDIDPNDPNQPRTGLVHFRGNGDGSFVRLGNVPEIGRPHQSEGRLKPVYSLAPFRRPGWSADWLAVTSETSSVAWLLGVGASGLLEIKQTLNWWGPTGSTSSYNVDSLTVGTVTRPAATREPDLVAVMQQA
ncbi:MAG: FG-GAP repeat domain-containing protein [Verrucomicrobiales bacterium]